jgi:DNA-binding MarR family transcriptional regulator
MILNQISEYLAHHKRATLWDLANHFDSDPNALQAMLAVLQRKGRVTRLTPKSECGKSCKGCTPESVEIYEWTDG